MRRRSFITLLGGAAAVWPLAAWAQQPDRTRRIGVLMAYAEGDREARAWIAAFRQELQKFGWTEDRSIRIEIRWATTDEALLQRFAKELIALQPDLILSSSTLSTAALLRQTRIIPIVFATVADPVGDGFVASFPRPSGNATGSPLWKPRWLASGWSCLRRLPHAPLESRASFTQRRRPAAAHISWMRSIRPPRFWQWR
jgi:putative ABC transport system substrate-binding protein